MKEKWKDIPDYEGFYQASNTGKIRSVDRLINHPTGSKSKWKGRILKPKRLPSGYCQVDLSKNGTIKIWLIHQLVMLAFVGKPEKKIEVNHKDLNKSNNALSNLEYVTRSQNQQHAMENLKKWQTGNHIRGEKSPTAKTKEETVILIRKDFDSGNFTQRELAKKYDMPENRVHTIVRRKSWTHI